MIGSPYILISRYLISGQRLNLMEASAARRIPKERPRSANTSLISVKDFLPKFGSL